MLLMPGCKSRDFPFLARGPLPSSLSPPAGGARESAHPSHRRGDKMATWPGIFAPGALPGRKQSGFHARHRRNPVPDRRAPDPAGSATVMLRSAFRISIARSQGGRLLDAVASRSFLSSQHCCTVARWTERPRRAARSIRHQRWCCFPGKWNCQESSGVPSSSTGA